MPSDLPLSSRVRRRLTAQETARRPRLDRLTSLRFFAAVLVVLHHTFRDLVVVPGLTHMLVMGTAGVGFFFVLSGFVLTWSSRPEDTAKAFYRRRFARVYPLHLLMIVLALPALFFIGNSPTIAELGPNVFLLQAWVPDSNVYFGVNAPSWSLACEAFFYAAFPLIAPQLARMSQAVLWRALASILVIGLAVAVLVTMLHADKAGFFLYVFPPFRILGFVAGCILARLFMGGWRFRIPLSWCLAATGVVYGFLLFVQYGLFWIGHGIEDAVLLPFVLAIIASAVSSDLDGKAGFLTCRWAVRLGEWSFALYLTHWVMLQVVAHLDPSANDRPMVFRVVEGLFFTATAVAVSGLAYKCVEAPLEKRLRGGRPRSEMVAAEVSGNDKGAGGPWAR